MSTAYLKTAIGGYFLDATISESHDFENTITENPVQTGANVNDHVFQKPILCTLQLFQSDCMASIKKRQFEDKGMTRSQSATAILRALWLLGDPLTVQTSLTTYKNMIIKSCIINKDKDTQTAIKATVILQQLIVTNAKAVSVTTVKSAGTATATSKNKHKTTSTNRGKITAITGSVVSPGTSTAPTSGIFAPGGAYAKWKAKQKK